MSVSLHGKVIHYDQIKDIPNRNSFLDKKIYDEISQNIKSGKPLLFMPNYIYEDNFQDKKYEKAVYKLVLFGVLLDGRRATIVISGIIPYFDILINKDDCNDNNENEHASELFESMKSQPDISPEKFEIVRGKHFKSFQTERSTFVRCYFNKLKTRNAAIKYIRSKRYYTANDDLSCYYRVVCRNYLTTFSSWVTISDYNIRTYGSSEYCVGIKGNVFDVNIKNYKTLEQDVTTDVKLSKDNTMTCCWDIETYSPDGQLPKPEFPDHRMFMIGITYQWYHSNTQILRVCLIDHPCDARPDYLTIICDSEKHLIKAFGKLTYKLKPELIMGFNDSDYDWPWLINRAQRYPKTLSFLADCFDNLSRREQHTDDNVMKYFKSEKIKLEADTYANGSTLVLAGYMNIDVRTVFRQIYPVSEKSNLNYYLGLNNISGKKDMPYQDMFKSYGQMTDAAHMLTKLREAIFPESDEICKIINEYACEYDYKCLLDKMAEIADYCVIDAQRCHELMKMRSVLMDRREVAKLSYTSVFDALYRANGMKVRNLVIARGQQVGIKFSNITNTNFIDGGKYPGAYVFPPVKGLVVSKLTMQERINLSNTEKYKEWSSVSEQELESYSDIIDKYGTHMTHEQVAKLHNVRKCFVDFVIEDIGRPITGLDFSSLYPSLIMAYNLSPEYIITNKLEAKQAHEAGHILYKIKFPYNNKIVRGWSIRHENKTDPKHTDFKFGIYPLILKELFDTRKQMKTELHRWESDKEKLEMLDQSEFIKPHIQEQYDKVSFNYNYINSKQNALKVFMNTFYGESGNKLSPFFVLQLAGAITTAGQYNIKLVQKYVESKKCKVMYGDTDSLYISIPEHYFCDIDKKYYTNKINKLDYWTGMVNITFDIIKIINVEVNNLLLNDNGTPFLKMAYEEALYPVAFLAKKKYYGIPHVSIPNFQPKKLFIRGIEVKKRGKSDLLKKICMHILEKSVSIHNLYTLIQLVEQSIDYIYKNKWDFKDFVMTDVFKPTKQNIKVHTFVNRMIAIGIKIKPYERFEYVIVQKNPYEYDHRGRKSNIQTGAKMELATYATDNNMSIDLDYYMKGSINGQLARLITYSDLFHVEPVSYESDDIQESEEKIYVNSCKYIESYCEKYYSKYESNSKTNQAVFKLANAAIVKKLHDIYPIETTILGSCYDVDNLEEWLLNKAEKRIIKETKNYGECYVKNALINLNTTQKKIKLADLQRVYFTNKSRNLLNTREKSHKVRQTLLCRLIRDNITILIKLLNQQTRIIINVSDIVKNTLKVDTIPNINISSEYVDAEIKILTTDVEMKTSLTKLKYIYINLLSSYNFIYKTRSIVGYLKTNRTHKIGLINPPSDKDHIKNSIDILCI